MKSTEYDTSFLSDLVLLRNNPNFFKKIMPIAEAGNPHAQYALGLIYAEGRGVKQDRIQAYRWLSLAIEQGDQDAILLRDLLINSMSKQELEMSNTV